MAAAPSSAMDALSRYTAIAAGKPASNAPGSPAAKAKTASEEFESVFLSSMFNEMFSGLKGEGPLGESGGAGVWRSFLADEYARSFAKNGGVGIGAEVYRTLMAQQEITTR
jgi:flagellar protein FlgJ